MIRAGGAVLAALLLLGQVSPALSAPAPRPNTALLAATRDCDSQARAMLEQLVAIDSGTGDGPGLAAVGEIYARALEGLGFSVKTIPAAAPAVGDNIVASLSGTGRGRVLLIAHMDTVFQHGAVAARKPHWEGDHYIGPGAGDDKAGGVTAICALGALKQIGYQNFGRIDLILNTNEETGSFGTRDLIREMSAHSDAAINLERGVPSDQVIVSRKGSAELEMTFQGRAAHSGLEPEKGRNAALEAARVALELGKLSDPKTETTVNVTILSGGDTLNVIPARALIRADVRAFTKAEFDRVEAAAARIAAAPGIEGVTIGSRLRRNFPPWPRASSTDALLARANRLYAEIGRQVTPTVVGSSADSALAAEPGTPTIDGFGLEGGGAHGVDDYADISTLAPRAYLLARMVMDLGANPPAKP